MKNKFLILIFATLPFCSLIGQINCISNLKFSVDSFDIIIIAVTPENLERFNIIENKKNLPHQLFINEFNKDSSFFLMNASICDSNCRPLGYLNINSKEIFPVNLNDGKGNFYLKPNGALLLTKSDAIIVESSFIPTFQNIALGLQSGPLLLNNGIVNPSFTIKSQNKKVRCGVGLFMDNNGEKKMVFIKSINPVSFYDFTMVFQNRFNCDAALCLESSSCIMNLPYLIDYNFEINKNIICRYISFKF